MPEVTLLVGAEDARCDLYQAINDCPIWVADKRRDCSRVSDPAVGESLDLLGLKAGARNLFAIRQLLFTER
jgi:hypothetical protein